jgi:hypothetical protein
VPEKHRSAGVTAIAILQIIGSAIFLMLAAFMAFRHVRSAHSTAK